MIPMIIAAIEVSFPQGPGSTMSPKPVVVIVATVKYNASMYPLSPAPERKKNV